MPEAPSHPMRIVFRLRIVVRDLLARRSDLRRGAAGEPRTVRGLGPTDWRSFGGIGDGPTTQIQGEKAMKEAEAFASDFAFGRITVHQNMGDQGFEARIGIQSYRGWGGSGSLGKAASIGR